MYFKNNKKSPVIIWLLFHLLLLLLASRGLPFKINTSLISILPESEETKELSRVETMYNDSLGSSMTILVGAADFEEARTVADDFYSELIYMENIQDISFEMDTEILDKYQNFLFEHRYRLLSPDTQTLLEAADVPALSERALITVFSPVSMGRLDHLEEDPFLLASDSLAYFLDQSVSSNTSMTLRDSVLTREFEGLHWVLVSMNYKGGAVDIELDSNPVPEILRVRDQLSNSDVEIILSGAPFHSYLSAAESKREITLLSTISSIFIIFLILYVFRSVLPLVFTISAILFGVVSGLASTLIFFDEIHIFTIVFGTSLIGISVDYSFHFFSEWSAANKTGKMIIKDVIPGIFVGLLTTMISYAAFIITSFPLLQQMALFSICGLFSTFLSVLLLFPYIKTAGERTVSCSNAALEKINLLRNRFSLSKISMLILSAGVLLFILFGMSRFELSYRLGDFYTMSDQLLSWEQKSASILAHESSGIHLIVEADNLDDCLTLEESLRDDLSRLGDEKLLKSYMSLSRFLPSRRTQDYNLSLVETVIMPSIEEQMSILGLETAVPSDGFADPPRYLELDDMNTLLPGSLLRSLHISRIADSYYTSILLFGVQDNAVIKDLSGKYQGVYLVDRVRDTETVLKDLSRLMIKIILISYILIFIGLSLRYKWKKALLIVGIPVISSLITLSVFMLAGVPVNLFVIVGLILIPGMGTDYLILLFESGKRGNRVMLSISMSFLTTVLAFGMLSFTSIASLFGMTVSLGIAWTYLITLLCSSMPILRDES
ncbi:MULTISPECIES: MMPL family transporter [unclassified Oceanispirochaeta]|uniref:MMPL family transporter n=1 Tax=unclassified Oceanispirochaeta TaxID=2635722 RepID=UPI001313F108|nr:MULTISPECIES: MMPL family transporter [unclassified Oceanispirochaeta]MBF9015483.1 MMPL family transporter [Oceanispirochaeta sp. M2]NPD71942.1 MMPL family transporter [Oceanispirochaeta sp. M1]